MRACSAALALVLGPGCAGDGAAATGGTTSGMSEHTGTAGTSTSEGTTFADETTGGFVPCTPAACVAGSVGCPCRGRVCDEHGSTCEGGRCTVIVDDMVRVPGGASCMGCNAGVDDDCVSDELPAHEVQLSTFDIDRTEVTQAAYVQCVEAGACPMPDTEGACSTAWDPAGLADHPVACIDWDAARGYCAWIGRRLPTEAEWERAARGVEALAYPWGDDAPTCELANFGNEGDECVGATAAVAGHPTGMSPYGAFDMAGNVWERVEDWYAVDYYEHGPVEDPFGAATGSSRVLRGGSFTSFAKFLRTSARDGARAPWVTARNLGFRCARTPQP